MIESMKTLAWPKKKREDFSVSQQEMGQPRANIGNDSLDKRFKQEWCQLNKSDNEIGDSSSRRDSSPKVAPWQRVEVINIEGKDLEPQILLPLDISAHRPHSQTGKR